MAAPAESQNIVFPMENVENKNVFNGPPVSLHPVYIDASSEAPGQNGPTDNTVIPEFYWDSSNSEWNASGFGVLKNIWLGKDIIGMPIYCFEDDGSHPELASLAFQDGFDLSKVEVAPIIGDVVTWDNRFFLDAGNPPPFYITDSIKLPEGVTTFPGVNLCSPLEFASSFNTNYEYSGYPETWYDGNGALTSYRTRVYLPSTVTELEMIDTSVNPFGTDITNTFGISLDQSKL